jgi:hypothetical protein
VNPGDRVRLKKNTVVCKDPHRGCVNKSAVVMDIFEGALVRLDRELGGLLWWNVADLQKTRQK